MEPIVHYCMDDRADFTGKKVTVGPWSISNKYTECPHCDETMYTLEEVVAKLYNHLVKDNS